MKITIWALYVSAAALSIYFTVEMLVMSLDSSLLIPVIGLAIVLQVAQYAFTFHVGQKVTILALVSSLYAFSIITTTLYGQAITQKTIENGQKQAFQSEKGDTRVNAWVEQIVELRRSEGVLRDQQKILQQTAESDLNNGHRTKAVERVAQATEIQGLIDAIQRDKATIQAKIDQISSNLVKNRHLSNRHFFETVPTFVMWAFFFAIAALLEGIAIVSISLIKKQEETPPVGRVECKPAAPASKDLNHSKGDKIHRVSGQQHDQSVPEAKNERETPPVQAPSIEQKSVKQRILSHEFGDELNLTFIRKETGAKEHDLRRIIKELHASGMISKNKNQRWELRQTQILDLKPRQ